MKEILVHIAESNVGFVDYLPYIISIISIISTLIITAIQLNHNYKIHKTNSSYDIKKDAIFEALDFLDTYISWLDISGETKPAREYIDKIQLTVKSRKIHNKLCVTCKNKKIVENYVDLICPNLKDGEEFFVFKKYDEFRNECRKELGFDEIDLPKQKGYIYYVNTRALDEHSEIVKKKD